MSVCSFPCFHQSGSETMKQILDVGQCQPDHATIRAFLEKHFDCEIVQTHGHLSDHYNPQTRTLALSDGVYASPSVAAIGIACHEAGHAIQHARNYAPLGIRSALVPMAGIGTGGKRLLARISKLILVHKNFPPTTQAIL